MAHDHNGVQLHAGYCDSPKYPKIITQLEFAISFYAIHGETLRSISAIFAIFQACNQASLVGWV